MDAGLPFRHDNRTLSSGSGVADLSAQSGEGERPVAWVNAEGGSNLSAAETPGSRPVEAPESDNADAPPARALAIPEAALGTPANSVGASAPNFAPAAAPETSLTGLPADVLPAGGTTAGGFEFSPVEMTAPSITEASAGAEGAVQAVAASPPPADEAVVASPPGASSWAASAPSNFDVTPPIPAAPTVPVFQPPEPPDLAEMLDGLLGDAESDGPGFDPPTLEDILPALPAMPDLGVLTGGPPGGESISDLIDLSNIMDEVLATLPVPADLVPAGGLPTPASAVAQLTDSLPTLGQGVVQDLLDSLPGFGDDADDDESGGVAGLADLPALPVLDQLLEDHDSGSAAGPSGALPDLDDVLAGPGGLLTTLFDGSDADDGPSGPPHLPAVLGGLLGAASQDDPGDHDGGGFGWG